MTEMPAGSIALPDAMRDRIRRNVKALLALYANGKTTALMPILGISRAKAYRLMDEDDNAEFGSVDLYSIAANYGIDVGSLYGNPDNLFRPTGTTRVTGGKLRSTSSAAEGHKAAALHRNPTGIRLVPAAQHRRAVA